jgi:hypothetical protein
MTSRKVEVLLPPTIPEEDPAAVEETNTSKEGSHEPLPSPSSSSSSPVRPDPFRLIKASFAGAKTRRVASLKNTLGVESRIPNADDPPIDPTHTDVMRRRKKPRTKCTKCGCGLVCPCCGMPTSDTSTSGPTFQGRWLTERTAPGPQKRSLDEPEDDHRTKRMDLGDRHNNSQSPPPSKVIRRAVTERPPRRFFSPSRSSLARPLGLPRQPSGRSIVDLVLNPSPSQYPIIPGLEFGRRRATEVENKGKENEAPAMGMSS